MVVVLPEPLGPSRPKISPRWILQVEGVEGGLLLAAPEVAVDLGQVAGLDDGIGHEAISGTPPSWGSGGMRGYDNE